MIVRPRLVLLEPGFPTRLEGGITGGRVQLLDEQLIVGRRGIDRFEAVGQEQRGTGEPRLLAGDDGDAVHAGFGSVVEAGLDHPGTEAPVLILLVERPDAVNEHVATGIDAPPGVLTGEVLDVATLPLVGGEEYLGAESLFDLRLKPAALVAASLVGGIADAATG